MGSAAASSVVGRSGRAGAGRREHHPQVLHVGHRRSMRDLEDMRRLRRVRKKAGEEAARRRVGARH